MAKNRTNLNTKNMVTVHPAAGGAPNHSSLRYGDDGAHTRGSYHNSCHRYNLLCFTTPNARLFYTHTHIHTLSLDHFISTPAEELCCTCTRGKGGIMGSFGATLRCWGCLHFYLHSAYFNAARKRSSTAGNW